VKERVAGVESFQAQIARRGCCGFDEELGAEVVAAEWTCGVLDQPSFQTPIVEELLALLALL